ncbi:hypothetical protein GCM10010191_58850 [Actinomadura vinacea]|uniref:DUF2255 family protein n=1 Tax=Actinomadura vinacea TaxID=115336 RepID=A0ABN3JPR0_9ACTN
MSGWTGEQLSELDAPEATIATRRRDGALRTRRTVLVVRDGDDLYGRSAYGREAAWFRGTRARLEGATCCLTRAGPVLRAACLGR